MAAAVARALALWAVAAVALWLHALAGVPGDYLRQGYPVYPGFRVTRFNLAIDAGLATLPILLFGVLAAVLVARWNVWRLVALPVVALLWLRGADGMIFPFTIDFGTTWGPFEALRALFLHPLHTPLALAVLMAATYALMAPRGRG
jgi:hypothetical protein